MRATSNVKWKANWIWCKGPKRPRNCYVYFRKRFDLSKKTRTAMAYVSADSRYKLYVNGVYVGRGPARCDPQWQYYDTYDIRTCLRTGENVIAALVHHYGEGTFSYILGKGGFFFQGEIEQENEHKLLLKTDESWRVAKSDAWRQDVPRISMHLGFQELYDANNDIEGWMEPGFDDVLWGKPQLIGIPPVAPWLKMVPRDIPFLRETQICPLCILEVGQIKEDIHLPYTSDLATVLADEPHEPFPEDKSKDFANLLRHDTTYTTIRAPRGNAVYIVLDFSKEVTGYPKIKVEGTKGGIIDFGYAEVLDNGRVKPNRGGEVKYADRYIMRNGIQSWENAFGLKGFRYMQVTIRNCDKPVRIYFVGLNFSTYPVQYQGLFECSDALLTKIWEVGRYTLELCMHDGYIDCPWREQGQWWGDGRIATLASYYAFGDSRLWVKALRQLAQSQRKDGMVRALYPAGIDIAHADYCLTFILSIHDYYLYTGDNGLVKELWPTVERAMEWFENHLDEEQLLNNIAGYSPSDVFTRCSVFIDLGVDTRGQITALNCFYYAALMSAATIAKLVAEDEQTKKYNAIASRLKKAINKYLWSEKKGAYLDCRVNGQRSEIVSQQTNSLVLLYSIAPPERRSQIVSRIFSGDKDIVKAQPPFMFYLLRALSRIEMYDSLAFQIIREFWGEMLKHGATTFWEFWDSPLYMSRTRCHSWSTSPVFDLPAEVLGVKPIDAGYRRFSVVPKTGNLSWAKGTVPTVRGNITVYWRKRKQGFEMRIHVPDGAVADIAVPVEESKQSVYVNGMPVWCKRGAPLETKGIIPLYYRRNHLYVKAMSGDYVFKAP